MADCDRDSLIFTVEQKDSACHKGTYSCFGEEQFDFGTMQEIIAAKKGSGSFTGRMLSDREALKAKILEEAKEVVNFSNVQNLRWELADLFYFAAILMEREGLKFSDIKNELKVRNFMKTYIKSTKL